jgi:hypothetical protein
MRFQGGTTANHKKKINRTPKKYVSSEKEPKVLGRNLKAQPKIIKKNILTPNTNQPENIPQKNYV